MPMTCREFATVCCPCGSRLDLHQLDDRRPEVLTGYCRDCRGLVMVRDADDGGWELLRLVPEAIAAAAG